MASVYIPEADCLIRYVPWSKLRKDDEDNVLGVLGIAFHLRDDEEFLSATWVEFFGFADRTQNITGAVTALRASALSLGKKSGFAVGEVSRIKAAFLPSKRPLRIIHEPEDDNPAHVAVRNWPREDVALLEQIAEDEWAELILNRDVP